MEDGTQNARAGKVRRKALTKKDVKMETGDGDRRQRTVPCLCLLGMFSLFVIVFLLRMRGLL